MPNEKNLGGAGRGSGSSRAGSFPSEPVANLHPGHQHCPQDGI